MRYNLLNNDEWLKFTPKFNLPISKLSCWGVTKLWTWTVKNGLDFHRKLWTSPDGAACRSPYFRICTNGYTKLWT